MSRGWGHGRGGRCRRVLRLPTLLISWNVIGTRAAWKKGLPEFVAASSPDVLCVQERKIQEDQLTPEIRDLGGYRSYWSVAAA